MLFAFTFFITLIWPESHYMMREIQNMIYNAKIPFSFEKIENNFLYSIDKIYTNVWWLLKIIKM